MHVFDAINRMVALERKSGDGSDDDNGAVAYQQRCARIAAAHAILLTYKDIGPAVRAKMQVNGIETRRYGTAPEHQYHKVCLGAIYGKEGENKDFADATPSGECWMQISDGRPALDFFKPGKTYYVTFTEAPE